MSYDTRHSLAWDNKQVGTEQVTHALAPMFREEEQYRDMLTEGLEDEIERTITGDQEARWHSADSHVCRLSLMWPGTLFTMEQLGEDGSRWTSFYRDGLFYSKEPEQPQFSEERFQQTARSG